MISSETAKCEHKRSDKLQEAVVGQDLFGLSDSSEHCYTAN